MNQPASTLDQVPAPPSEPAKAHVLRFLYRLGRRRRELDLLFTPMLKHRHYLPVAPAESLIPGFCETSVTLSDLPRGSWATPLVDTLTVVKAAIGFGSKRVLEVGSYKGATARLIAENTTDQTRIWTLDEDPKHGSSYLGTPIESRIHRVVGKATPEILKSHGPFDLIFVDADHDYESVFRHSVAAFGVLAPGGSILWHDYQHHDFLHGLCGVPEALHVASIECGKRIVSIENTMLALYSDHPGWETSPIASSSAEAGRVDPWSDNRVRGN
jgi:predicted O-methyltransferase YrrM